MIPVTSQLKTLLNGRQYWRADLYTITLTSGTVLRWTAWPVPLTWEGNTWMPTGVVIVRDKWKVVIGLETSDFTMTIGIDPLREPAVNGVPLRQTAGAGLLDAAAVELDWAYLGGSPPALVGILPRVFGRIGDAEVTRSGIQLTINSPMKLLDMQVPAKIYGPPCRWTLGDKNCGVNLASFAVAGAAGNGATAGVIPCDLANPANYFNLGIVTFTSGVNEGVARQVQSYAPGSMTLLAPLPFAPAAGDTFSVTPGCDHTLPSMTVTITVPAGGYSGVLVPGAASFGNLGVVYGSGPHAGTALVQTQMGVQPGTGQYAYNAGNYTFSGGDAGLELIVSFVANGANATGTCASTFNNVANFGGMPFTPPPEVGF